MAVYFVLEKGLKVCWVRLGEGGKVRGETGGGGVQKVRRT